MVNLKHHRQNWKLLVSLILYSSCVSPAIADNYESYMTRGTLYWNKGQYDYAISDYTQAIKVNPKSADAFHNIGGIYAMKKQYAQSLPYVDKAIALAPRSAEYRNSRATILFVTARYDESLISINKAIELDPNNLSYKKARALVYILQSAPKKALPDLALAERAKESTAEKAKTFHYLGMCYLELPDLEKAKIYLEKARRLEPTFADTHALMSLVNFEKADYDNAFASASKAVHLDPDHTNAYVARANASLKKGDLEKSLSDCQSAIKRKNPQGYYILGLVLESQGKTKAATDAFQSFVTEMPLDPNKETCVYKWLGEKRLAEAKVKLAAATSKPES